MKKRKSFLILLGVSGVGKTTLIKELINIDSRFIYISPYTNRVLRNNADAKIYKTDIEIEALIQKNEILIVNEMYGYKFATPKTAINVALATGNFPLLDFPIQKIDLLKEKYGDRIFSVYIMPPSIEILKKQLGDGRDKDGRRYKFAVKEIEDVFSNKITSYDIIVTNHTNQVSQVASVVYNYFLDS